MSLSVSFFLSDSTKKSVHIDFDSFIIYTIISNFRRYISLFFSPLLLLLWWWTDERCAAFRRSKEGEKNIKNKWANLHHINVDRLFDSIFLIFFLLYEMGKNLYIRNKDSGSWTEWTNENAGTGEWGECVSEWLYVHCMRCEYIYLKVIWVNLFCEAVCHLTPSFL